MGAGPEERGKLFGAALGIGSSLDLSTVLEGLVDSAAAVSPTEIAVTFPGPSFSVSRSEKRLEITVPREIRVEMIPAYEKGTPMPSYITGQAEPSTESGSPRLIKAA